LPVSGSKKGSKNQSAFRLHSLENKDAEELYQFVEKGTKVEIIR
jgi:hypothetical protein